VTALKPAQERALKTGDSFKACRDCPDMIVVPAVKVMMAAAASKLGGKLPLQGTSAPDP
jgi:hypothetical protein